MTIRNFLMRNYDRLVDWCFWLFALLSLPGFTRYLGLHDTESSGIWSMLSMISWVSVWLTTIVLVLAKPIRDEFAEALWQKAAAKFVYVMAIVPAATFIVMGFFIGDIAESMRLDTPPPIGRPGTGGFVSPEFSELLGVFTVLFFTALYMPIVFLALYKWQRWRAS